MNAFGLEMNTCSTRGCRRGMNSLLNDDENSFTRSGGREPKKKYVRFVRWNTHFDMNTIIR